MHCSLAMDYGSYNLCLSKCFPLFLLWVIGFLSDGNSIVLCVSGESLWPSSYFIYPPFVSRSCHPWIGCWVLHQPKWLRCPFLVCVRGWLASRDGPLISTIIWHVPPPFFPISWLWFPQCWLHSPEASGTSLRRRETELDRKTNNCITNCLYKFNKHFWNPILC